MQTELLPDLDYSTSSAKSPTGRKQGGFWARMSPDCSRHIAGATLLQWLESWLGAKLVFQPTGGRIPAWHLDQKDSSSGQYWTLNGGDWRNGASVCLLSEILETGKIDRRYYLSPKACAGILRRAKKRGKVLPQHLMLALRAVAGLERTSKQGGGLSKTLRARANSSNREDSQTFVAHSLNGHSGGVQVESTYVPTIGSTYGTGYSTGEIGGALIPTAKREHEQG